MTCLFTLSIEIGLDKKKFDSESQSFDNRPALYYQAKMSSDMLSRGTDKVLCHSAESSGRLLISKWEEKRKFPPPHKSLLDFLANRYLHA